jgi:RepB DNA-primase from phage plasmid
VFLTIETSPGNFPAWLALPGMEDKDFARRLRKGTGADTTASGATRVAGSVNFKDKYDAVTEFVLLSFKEKYND